MKHVDGMMHCWPDGCTVGKWQVVDVQNDTIYKFPTCDLMCKGLNDKLHLTKDTWDRKLVYSVYHNRLSQKRLKNLKKIVLFNKN